ncbi:hypothetical protein GCM10008906_09280 [Clostridium oceanicum]|uniref:Uncharacterized protein n=1 Tax=Clostridium oceanicum TaxID=1543 RepID=A0ABN1JC77_9CLOT
MVKNNIKNTYECSNELEGKNKLIIKTVILNNKRRVIIRKK